MDLDAYRAAVAEWMGGPWEFTDAERAFIASCHEDGISAEGCAAMVLDVSASEFVN
jgi:hypothetical protein